MPDSIISTAKDAWAILLGLGGLVVWFVRLEALAKSNSAEVKRYREELKEHIQDQKERRAEAVKAETDRRLRALAAKYSSAERETWPVQVAEAEAVLADNTATAPLLRELAAAKGVSVTEMAKTVLSKRDAMAAASGAVLAAKRRILAMDPIPEDYEQHFPKP